MRILVLSILAAVTSLGCLQPTFAEEYSHQTVIPFQVHTQESSQQEPVLALECRSVLRWNECGGSLDFVALWKRDEDSSECWHPGQANSVTSPKKYTVMGDWDNPDPLVLLFYTGNADFCALDERASYLLFCWPYPPCWDMYEDQFCIGGETVNVMGWLPPGATLSIPDESELLFAAAVDSPASAN